MAKISLLPEAAEATGNETVVVLAEGKTARVRLLDLLRSQFRFPVGRNGGLGFTLADALSRVWFEVTPKEIRHPAIDRLASASPTKLQGTMEFFLAGRDRRKFLSITPDTFQHPVIDDLVARVGAGGTGGYDELRALYEIIAFLIYGASHSRGINATPPISTVASTHALMFAGGVRPDDGAAGFSDLVGLAEQYSPDGASGETIASGMCEAIVQLLIQEDGADPALMNQLMLVSSSGLSGTPLTTLADPTSTFGVRLQAALTNGNARAGERGKTYQPLCMPMPFGSTDYDRNVARDDWAAGLRALRAWMEAAAQATTGRTDRPLPIVLAQQATHPWYGRAYPSVALAALDLARERYFACACPTYIFPQGSDNLHFTAVGSKWLGAVMGFYIKRWFWDGEKIEPLVPTASRSGASIMLRFPVRDKRRLIIDKVTVAEQPQWGFAGVDGAGAAVPLNNLRQIGRDIIAFDPVGGSGAIQRVRYAWQGSAYKGLGNVRDDDPTIFDPNGLALPIQQWAPISEVIL